MGHPSCGREWMPFQVAGKSSVDLAAAHDLPIGFFPAIASKTTRQFEHLIVCAATSTSSFGWILWPHAGHGTDRSKLSFPLNRSVHSRRSPTGQVDERFFSGGGCGSWSLPGLPDAEPLGSVPRRSAFSPQFRLGASRTPRMDSAFPSSHAGRHRGHRCDPWRDEDSVLPLHVARVATFGE
jgi:hypothetical protein